MLDWIAQTFPDLREVQALGEGGQKAVFAATNEEGRQVVLKIFLGKFDNERALREIEAYGKVKCATIPVLLNTGVAENDFGKVLWVIEERVPGTTLRECLGRTPARNSLARIVLRDVLAALTEAERAKIVHRDIKPENIMISPDGDRAWLLDFGIARHLELAPLTSTGQAFGPCTFGYASPEQISNNKDEIDSRSDLFSLAVTLFEVVEGSNPLRDGLQSPMEVADATRNNPLPRIRDADGENKTIADLVEAMSRPRRDHRPATVAEAHRWFLENAREGMGG